MPLLAPQHKLVLRHLLSRGGTALPSELSTATGLETEDVLNALDHLHRTDLAVPMPHTPGLGEGRWSLTSHGRQVGPSLAKGEPNSRTEDDSGDPAEGWGFPWRPVKKEAPVYARTLPRPTRENRKAVRRPLFPLQVPKRPPSRRRWGLLAAASLVTLAGIVLMLITIRQVSIEIGGIEDGVALQPTSIEGMQISFTVAGANARSAQLLLDDFPVSGVQRYGNRIVWVVPPLTEGDHSLELVVERRLYGQVSRSIDFNVDGTPPVIGLPEVLEPVPMDEPVTIAGTSEPGATLVVGGVPIETRDGSFILELDEPPAGPVSILAIDRAGNTSTFNMIVPIAYPRTQGVHVSAAAWAHQGLKDSVLDLIEAGKVTAVEISLKNESGVVGYDSDVALAIETGAANNLFNLRAAIEELHALDVRVIGRIVAFRDPILAKHAWAKGDQDWVIQTSDGRPLSKYGGFTNFQNPGVQKYNLDIAREAAEAGIDDVLWDYMRRPEGRLDGMYIPGVGLDDPSPIIVDFLRQSQSILRDFGVFQGVSVFGISATRGEFIAQDVAGMAQYVDYVSPMVYPSHWSRGEYGVTHPEAQPYDITRASLADFQRVLDGTNTALVPWLQDFSMRVPYGPAEVKAQIDAAASLGIHDWLLWDPTVTYTAEGIVPARS